MDGGRDGWLNGWGDKRFICIVKGWMDERIRNKWFIHSVRSWRVDGKGMKGLVVVHQAQELLSFLC